VPVEGISRAGGSHAGTARMTARRARQATGV